VRHGVARPHGLVERHRQRGAGRERVGLDPPHALDGERPVDELEVKPGGAIRELA
jgi:hypothetical protein